MKHDQSIGQLKQIWVALFDFICIDRQMICLYVGNILLKL